MCLVTMCACSEWFCNGSYGIPSFASLSLNITLSNHAFKSPFQTVALSKYSAFRNSFLWNNVYKRLFVVCVQSSSNPKQPPSHSSLSSILLSQYTRLPSTLVFPHFRCSGNGAHYPGRFRYGSAEPRLRLCCRLFLPLWSSSSSSCHSPFIPHTATHLFTVFIQRPVQYSNRPDYTPLDPSSREGHRTAVTRSWLCAPASGRSEMISATSQPAT